MIALTPIGPASWTLADMGTTTTITDFPKEFPIRRLFITIFGTINVTGGGTTDYTLGTMFGSRWIDAIRFRLGGNNVLKNVPGYAAFFQTALMYPNLTGNIESPPGTQVGAGFSTSFRAMFAVDFSDQNTIQSDKTMLLPNLYEDLSLEIDWNATVNSATPTLGNLATAGDRPFNLTSGFMGVQIEQELDPQVDPRGTLNEFIETFDVSTTGPFEIDMPRSQYIEMVNMWAVDNGVPTSDPAFFQLLVDMQVDVNNGKFILFRTRPINGTSRYALDYGTMFPNGFVPPVGNFNFNGNHDMYNVFDNRTAGKWTMKGAVNTAANRQIIMHYVGRSIL